MKTFADLIIKFRWLIIIAFLAITVILGSRIPKAEIDPDMINQLPTDISSRMSTDRIEELFGGTDMLMILIEADDVLNQETLKRIKNMSRQMKKIKGVDKVLSLFDLKRIKGEDGMMTVDPVVKRIPKNDEQKKNLRQEIMDNDIVYGSVISKDFTITAVVAILEADVSDEYIVGEIQKIAANNPGAEETVIGGVPYTRFQVAMDTKNNMSKLLPIGLTIMLVFLYFCFKQLRGVILPFIVVVMSILVAMGLIPLLGWKIQVVTIILPVLLIAVANDYGIHMIAKYQEDNILGNSYTKKELARRMFRSLAKPILMTGLTTMAGMLCLLGHLIVSARQLGILAAIGIAFALAASLLFIPAITSLLPISKPVVLSEDDERKRPFLERLLIFFGDFVSKKPKIVIAGSLLFSIIASIGIFFVKVDADPVNYYRKDHPVVRAVKMIDQNLGGSFGFAIAFEGDIKEPKIMNKIDKLEHDLGEIPEIGNTTSIARVIRQMSRALNDEGEEWYDQIPDSRNAIAQYFELYGMSGDPDDFEKLVDFPYEHALLTARINTSSTPKVNKVMRQVKNMVDGDRDVKDVGGIALIFSEVATHVVNGQFLSLGMAVVAVAILLIILFRSVTAGLISAIPLALSMAILFGLMGLLGIELNVATAMLSSIMIGVGIDYTIHFLWRYKEEREEGLEPREAVNRTLTTTGRGIIFNALSVIIGFVVLLLSDFMPVKFFGFLVVVCVFACLVGALVLIPALCLILKPKFLEPKSTINN